MVLNSWARWALVTIPRFCIFLHFAILKVNAHMKFAKCRGHFRHFPRTHIKKCFDKYAKGQRTHKTQESKLKQVKINRGHHDSNT